MPTRASARHRAPIRPKTPLAGLTSGATGRRSVVIAASSGLLLTGAIPVANATPVADPLAVRAAQSAEPEQDVQQPEVAPDVMVPLDAPVNFASTALTTATPPPPPPPPPAPVVAAAQPRTQDRASRSEQRQPLAAAARSIAATPAAATVSGHGGVLAVASRYVGTMYRYGGTTPAGFDCSGFTQYVYRQMGVSLPRTSGGQAAAGQRISASQARPGDLVYTPGHIGIYAGGNKMIDSPHSGAAVGVRDMWFTPTFIRVG